MINGSVLNSELLLKIDDTINGIFQKAIDNNVENREQIIVDGFTKEILSSDVSLYKKLVAIKKSLAFTAKDMNEVYQFKTFALKKGMLDYKMTDDMLTSFIDNIRSDVFNGIDIFDSIKAEFENYGMIPGLNSVSPRPLLKDEDINKYEDYLHSYYSKYMGSSYLDGKFRPPYPNEMFAWRNGGMVQLETPSLYYQMVKSMFENGTLVVQNTNSNGDTYEALDDDISKFLNNEVIDYSKNDEASEKDLFAALDNSSKKDEFDIKDSKPTINELLDKIRECNSKLCFLESASDDRSVEIDDIKEVMKESLKQIIEAYNESKNDEDLNIGYTIV